VGVRAVRHLGALPYVRGRHHQQPSAPGGVRCCRHQSRVLRLGDRPVRAAIQPPSGGGKGAAGGRGAAAFAGIFCFPAGKAGGQTPLEAPGARKQGKIRKNSGNCVKNCSSHFLFGLDCGILFNGILSKPIATAGRHAKAPDLCRTHKRNAALSGDGHRVFPVWALRPAENTEQEGYTLVRGRV